MKQRLIYTIALLFATMQTYAQTYTYDSNNRLTKLEYDNGTTITYTFDALGNRTGKKITGGSTPVDPDAVAYAWLSSDGKTLTFCYDNKREERNGETYDLNGLYNPEWNPDPWNTPCDVTSVVFEPSFAQARPTSTFSWFCNCEKLTEIIGLENLNTSKVTCMYSMFRDCKLLKELNVSHFDTSNVTMLWAMFDGCSNLESLDVSNFDTSKVTDMTLLFSFCKNLKNLKLGHFDTSNVTNMYMMFIYCSNLTSLDVSSFNTSKVTDMQYMFDGCSGLTSLDVSNFDMTKAQYSTSMFSGCSGLKSLSVSLTMNNIKDDACYGIGTTASRCFLYAPNDFDFGIDASGSSFEWKQGFFKSATYIPGDVNKDGNRNKQDVEYLVNAILNNQHPTKGTDLNNDGKLNVADITLLVEAILDGNWPIVNNGHEYVDLGLPSGTLWATCNVGASKPEEVGCYYAWGETKTKDNYSQSTYNYWNSQYNTGDDLGDDIRGTEYDVAHIEWGGDWQMPSLVQIKELLDNCLYEVTTVNGVKGMKFVGSNAKSIFFPFAGFRQGTELYSQGSLGVYRTGIPSSNLGTLTYYLYVDSGGAHWDKYAENRFYRYNGMTVRPAISSSEDDSGTSPEGQHGGPGADGEPIDNP